MLQFLHGSIWLSVILLVFNRKIECQNDNNGRDDRDSSGDGPVNPELTSSFRPATIRFSFLTTDGDINYVDSSIAAVHLAVEHINANASILPHFMLDYSLKTLQCSQESALDAFFQDVFSRDSIIAFLGSACSQATQPIAELVHRWNISEILSSPLIIEPNEGAAPTSNLLRMYPQESLLVPALLSFVMEAGWKRMFVISGRDEMFQPMFNILSSQFEQQNITVANRDLSETGVDDIISDLLGEVDNYRIIFLNTNPAEARQVLCAASKEEYVYPRYTWILYGWYGSHWWQQEMTYNDRDCSDKEILKVLDRALSLRVYPMPSDKDSVSDTGISYNQFHAQYSQSMQDPTSATPNTNSFIAPLTYDAVWTLALALHHVDTSLTNRGIDMDRLTCEATEKCNGKIGEFTYSDTFLGCLIIQELRQTNFVGVSGAVSFNEDGARSIADVTLLQYQNSEVDQIIFATYDIQSQDLVFIPGENIFTVFPDGVSPDGTPRNDVITFSLGLTITYYVIASLGLMFTFVCLIFNIKYRKTRVVKLTSPTMNYFLIIGAVMMFSSIYIRVLPNTEKIVNEWRCNIQNWLNIIAYCFGYGTILTKMGRVYKIFHNPTTKKKQAGVKDWHMVMVVTLIVGIGVVLLIIEASVPQLRPNLALLSSEEHSPGKDELGVTINYFAWQCYGGVAKAPYYYLLFMFCYLGLLQLIGLVLAIRTRKVKITILNDSKHIAAIIYVSSLVIVVMALVTFVSGTRVNLNEAFFSAGLLLSTSIFLGLTFIPKMISYYHDPSGERVMKSVTGTHCVELHTSGGMTVRRTEQKRIERLESRVSELEGELSTYKNLCLGHVLVNGRHSYVDGAIQSPRTSYSHVSESTLSHSSLFRSNNLTFGQHCSVESNSSSFALGSTSTRSVYLRGDSVAECKPSPITRTVIIESESCQPVTCSPHNTLTSYECTGTLNGDGESTLSLADNQIDNPDNHHHETTPEPETPDNNPD